MGLDGGERDREGERHLADQQCWLIWSWQLLYSPAIPSPEQFASLAGFVIIHRMERGLVLNNWVDWIMGMRLLYFELQNGLGFSSSGIAGKEDGG